MQKNYGTIELFAEKTGYVVRTIRFHNQSFRRMRYPGYGWRYKYKAKKDKER